MHERGRDEAESTAQQQKIFRFQPDLPAGIDLLPVETATGTIVGVRPGTMAVAVLDALNQYAAASIATGVWQYHPITPGEK